MQTQAKALAQRPHVVVATPGRLRVRFHASSGIAVPCMRIGSAWLGNVRLGRLGRGLFDPAFLKAFA